ncbi:cell division transport system ATP-binding protein [Agromyces hippuratus]|uniref:Cell division ATP-binding protein FtsE n=1 Tax=Agromyces hippuratus TaxID=286438 RepID=A0A852X314_9MICO|nr:cell division ATP-binding protein FtsE [Agromyces hippuratus]NYG20445.1 cell division transport system ATP-binding protein [Agromyces hippuratus]
MIRFDSVTKTYPGQARPALNDIGVEILRGEFVFLVGASGSGKSSFLRLILKEEKPSKGAIHVLGQDLGSISTRKVPYFRRDLGVVFQDFRLLPNKSVYENVAFTLRVIGKSRGYVQSAVPETLKLVGLDGKGKRMPHELSGGEQQRVAIARAIVNKPQILLADEPTGNLDPVTSAGIMTLLERINASGTTIVMATHEAGIVDQMRRRVIELSAGDIVRDERSAGYDGQTVRDVEVVPRRGSGEPGESGVPDASDATADSDTPAAAPVVTAAAPKVTPEVMRDAEPLYVEPEATDAVTDAAAEITAAATGTIQVDPEQLKPKTKDAAAASEHLTLAERLGLRAPGGPREGDDDQEVGPTK